jgi:hypothetical protein
MAAEPSKAEQPVIGVRPVVQDKALNGAAAAKPDAFAPLREFVEQMVKDAREEGRKAGVVEGRVLGLRRACTLLGIAMSKLSVDDRNKLAGALEDVEHELVK